jgi:ribose 5-phosphate isomerase
MLQYEQLIAEIEQIGGVVTHGLLLNAADALVIADQKEGVRVVECEKQQQAAAAAASSS